MPTVTGVELLKKIHAAHMAIPSIMATGMPPMEQFKRAPWIRPDAILLKPYTLDELLRMVTSLLNQPEQTLAPTHTSPGIFHKQILVADEDPDIRSLFTEVLTSGGYEVGVAEDGGAAWEALQSNEYNLLITENQLPKMTGIELVRKARAAHMAMPVIMAADRLPTYQLARNPSLQLAATLSKPFEVGTLMETVKQVLREPNASLQPDCHMNASNAGLRF
jgi:DNA-binding NtrC family response regulator